MTIEDLIPEEDLVVTLSHGGYAKAQGLDSLFVLTTRTMHWFIKRGFQPVDPDWLPEASSWPFGLQASVQHSTGPQSNCCCASPVATSQIRTWLSSELEATSLPSGCAATEITPS